MISWASAHKARAKSALWSKSRDLHVKPSPIALTVIPIFWAARCSPKFAVVCLMNCSMTTFISRPQARKRTPIAAVVLPFPLPVFTITNP